VKIDTERPDFFHFPGRAVVHETMVAYDGNVHAKCVAQVELKKAVAASGPATCKRCIGDKPSVWRVPFRK